MNAPLISVCIPTYNQVHFLRRTLDSLVDQNYENFEVIVSDDSSTEIVKNLVEEYKGRLNVVYHKNAVSLGSPANWNKAIDLSSGEFIKIVHHDDWLKGKDSLQQFADAFAKHPQASLVFCDSEILDVKNSQTRYNVPPPEFISRLKKQPEILFNDNRIGSPTAVIFRRSALRFDIEMKFLVDLDFYIELLQNGSFVYIPRALIVNTSNHSEQVTAASMNAETQVRENIYLYNKLFNGKLPSPRLTMHFIRLFRNYGINRWSKLAETGSPEPKPVWYFKLLVLLSRI